MKHFKCCAVTCICLSQLFWVLPVYPKGKIFFNLRILAIRNTCTSNSDHFNKIEILPGNYYTGREGPFLFVKDLNPSYKDRISYSIIRDKRSRRIYKFYKKWSNLEGWKQLFFSTPPERLPVRCEFRTQAQTVLHNPCFDNL